MNNYQNIPSLREYVLVKKDKNTKELERVALEWAKVCQENHLSYEIDWLGVPVIQTPEDLVLLQELIFQVQPDIIMEIGIAHGGGGAGTRTDRKPGALPGRPRVFDL